MNKKESLANIKILSSNIKETPQEILDSIQKLSDYYFGEDKAFQYNLRKYDAQLFYVLDKNRVNGFLVTFIAKSDNEYVNKVFNQKDSMKKLKDKLFPFGFLYETALEKELMGTGLSLDLVKMAEDFFIENKIDNSIAFAWQYNNRLPAKILKRINYEVIDFVERPWQEKCDAGLLECPYKKDNPQGKCNCRAVIYYKTDLLSKKQNLIA